MNKFMEAQPKSCAKGANIQALLLERIPAAVAIFDREMLLLTCSKRWLIDFCNNNPDVIGRSHYEMLPEISAEWRDAHQRALAGETLSSDLERLKRADGSIEWVQWEAMPWKRDDGEIGGIIIFAQLLTDLVKSRQKARSVDHELNLLIDSATHHAICLLDDEGRVIIWNSGAERLYGWSEAEVLGKSYDMMFPLADRQSGLPRFQLEEAARNRIFRGQSKRIRKDGSQFLVEVTINRIADASGEPIGFGQVVRDITEDVEQAHALEASSSQLKSILEIVPDGVITINDHGIVQSFSATAELMFGFSADEVIGHNISMLMPEPDGTRHDGYLARYRATGEKRIMGESRRVFGRRKDGSIFPHELFVGEALGGQARLYTGFLRDLSDREEAEAKLQQLQAELNHIARVTAMGTMTTALAHELNQPLTSVTNYVQASAALLAEHGDEALCLARSALEEAGKEALRAGQIVHRLRKFISRGDVERVPTSPLDVGQQACALGFIEGKSKGINCEVAIDPDADQVLVDQIQIQQVVINLVRNAIEAIGNTPGSVIVSAGAHDGNMTRFTVADDGPGIAPEVQQKLFEPFNTSKSEGMGLGLSICRAIVEAHGGRLWFEAVKDGGTAFHFTVPNLSGGAGDN